MPSTQTPPLGGSALDPTAVRPPIDDALIERVELAQLHARLTALRAEGYSMLGDLGAVDYLKRSPRFDVVYLLLKMPTSQTAKGEIVRPRRLRVLCGLHGDAPHAPTVTDLWKSADWAEREIFDLFGVVFDGHPNMERIQMPHDWKGHPLRKDYPLRGPATERAPRPSFALKSNLVAGTPPSGRTLEALQEEVKRVRSQGSGSQGGSQ